MSSSSSASLPERASPEMPGGTPLEGSITASCGCKLRAGEKTITIRYSGEDCCWDGFHPCVTYAEYCHTCAEKARAWPEFLPTEDAADAWLASNVRPYRPAESEASIPSEASTGNEALDDQESPSQGPTS